MRRDGGLAEAASFDRGTLAGWESTTSRVDAFEAALAERVGVRHAIAASNATVAMELAYRAGGLASGATVLLSPLAGAAAANAVLACGARFLLADVDERGHLDPGSVAHRLALGREPTVVVPSHYAGHPADVAAVAAVMPRTIVVEDATEALGAGGIDGRPVGACIHAAMTVIGFGSSRRASGGQGAAVVTNDVTLAARLRWLRAERSEYRLSELLATLGSIELGRLDGLATLRARVAATYETQLAALPLVRPIAPDPRTRSSWRAYLVRMPAVLRPHVIAALAACDTGARTPAVPLHRHPAYRRLVDVLPAELPGAERLWAEALVLPCAPTMDAGDVARIVGALVTVLRADVADAHPAW